MRNEGSKQVFSLPEASKLVSDCGPKGNTVEWRVVRHPRVLGITPHALIRVQFRGIGREFFGADAPMLPQVFPNQLRPIMSVAPVPDYRHWSSKVPVQVSEELDHLLRSDVVIVGEQLEVQSQSLTFGADSDRADCRYPVTTVPTLVYRSLATRSKCAADCRSEHKPRFV